MGNSACCLKSVEKWYKCFLVVSGGRHSEGLMDARDCGKLGDAYFALHAQPDAVILTTNLKDHAPLANALGKQATSPEA